jgi:hypothetical protein
MICDSVDLTCKPGCRGTGNGCSDQRACTSTDQRGGKCAECLVDSDCGDVTSGLVCNEERQCVFGCRGEGGNRCRPNTLCSSADGSIGECASTKSGGCAAGDATGVGILVAIAVMARRLFFRTCRFRT